MNNYPLLAGKRTRPIFDIAKVLAHKKEKILLLLSGQQKMAQQIMLCFVDLRLLELLRPRRKVKTLKVILPKLKDIPKVCLSLMNLNFLENGEITQLHSSMPRMEDPILNN